jgi:hypothetical protein
LVICVTPPYWKFFGFVRRSDEGHGGGLKPLIVQCRLFGDDPVAEPRSAAGGRSSNIIISVRRQRPSSIVRPFPFWGGLFGTCLWVAPIVAIDVGQQPKRRPAGASGSLGAALAHARRFGAKKVNAGCLNR